MLNSCSLIFSIEVYTRSNRRLIASGLFVSCRKSVEVPGIEVRVQNVYVLGGEGGGLVRVPSKRMFTLFSLDFGYS